MLAGWGILSPISKRYGWAPGPVGDMTTGARGWILWTSLAIMCSDSVVSLVPVVWESVMKIRNGRSTNPATFEGDDTYNKDDSEVETEDRLVSNRWVLWGLVCSITSGTIIVWLVFGNEGIKPWATLIGFAMGGLLSILGYVLRRGFCNILLIFPAFAASAPSARRISTPSAGWARSASYSSPSSSQAT